jgi:hypothetical protein
MLTKSSVKNIFFFLCCLLPFSFQVISQTTPPPDNTPKIMPPSPEAAALGKYGDFGVGMFSGTPQFSIDLYTIRTPHLQVPLSLNYSTNGIKVDELASRVGMSWTLQAGGVISRTVYDKPDFGFNVRAPLPPGADFNETSATANDVVWMQDVDVNEKDMQMDEFNFSFPGYSGKFFINLNNQPVLMPYAPLKVEMNPTGTDWNFKITTPDGIKYYFGGGNATETSYSSGCNNTDIDVAPTSWYLKKIEHPYDDSDYIEFIYAPTNCSYALGVSQSITLVDPVQIGNCTDQENPLICSSCGPSPFIHGTKYSLSNGATNYCQTSTVISGVYLTEIRDSKHTKTTFSYISKPDVSSGTDYLVSKITILNQRTNEVIKTFDFSYTMATATGYVPYYQQPYQGQTIRPFLTGVNELDRLNMLVKPYRFYYNDIQGMPVRGSYAQDYWGYFNGVNNMSTMIPMPEAYSNLMQQGVIANRNPDYIYARKGLLSKIEYPTGGSTSVEYEGNTQNASYTGPGGTTTGVYQSFQSINVSPSNRTATFEVREPLTVQINATVSCNCPTANNCPQKQDADIWGQLIRDGVTIADFTFQEYNARGECSKLSSYSFVLSPGLYGIGLLPASQAPYNTTLALTVEEGKYVYQYQGVPPSTAPLAFTGGGLRVKKISSFDPVANNTSIKKFEYDGMIIPESPKYARTFYRRELFWVWSFPPESCNPLDDNYIQANYIQFSSSSLNNLFATGGTPVYYSKVTELFGDQKENGGIEHQYSFSAPPAFIRLMGNSIYSIAVPRLGWKNGLETIRTHFKMDGNNKVNTQKQHFTYASDIRKKETLHQYLVERSGNADLTTNLVTRASMFNVSKIPYVSEWQYLSSEKTEHFDIGGNLTVTDITNYYYDNEQHAQLTRIERIDSKGAAVTEWRKYPGDNISGLTTDETTAINQLLSQWRKSELIESEQYVGTVLQVRSHNVYNLVNNSALLVKSTAKNGSADPHTVFTIDNYDAKGRIKSMVLSNGFRKSYIYDYQSVFPIAEATNAAQSDLAFTSFEADATGNWEFAGSPIVSAAFTGRKSYAVSAGAIGKTNLTIGMSYVLSYWSKSGTCIITNVSANIIETGKSINGWTFYKHIITPNNTSISVSGNVVIDELRLYPKNARMATVTYDPLIGVTSQTDENDQTIFYEYDNFNRLLAIRDEEQNILRRYEYEYAKPAPGSSCGSNCIVMQMQTLKGTQTISYPVGVFNVDGKLLGNAIDQTSFVALWNSDTFNQARGTLAAGSDPLYFNLTLNTGATVPSGVTGCRYYQFDLPYAQIDGIRRSNAAYIDFGDGAGMHLGKSPIDNTGVVLAPNTTEHILLDYLGITYYYYKHNYTDNSLKQLTFYHNDEHETPALDNVSVPASSLMLLRNLRGIFPQNATELSSSCYQQASALSVANISNWNSITSIKGFHIHNGDSQNPATNVSYAQDFMANNRGLEGIYTAHYGPDRTGYRDLSFKISRLKNGWNTYFTRLKEIMINDDHWDREDLSELKQLKLFVLSATRQNHQDDPGSPLVPIPSTVIDTILNQIAAGAGQSVQNGIVNIISGGNNRTSVSDASVSLLKSKGWTIYVNGALL